MNSVALRDVVSGLMLVALLLPAAGALAAPEEVAMLTLQYQQSERKWISDGESLFGHYLGSGDGAANGALEGSVTWDLYEDQSHEDVHPAHFRGFVERKGERHSFQIIGVYTPDGTERASTPGGHETFRNWSRSGTIVFEDDALLGVRHAPVTGNVDTGVGVVRHTVWVEREGER